MNLEYKLVAENGAICRSAAVIMSELLVLSLPYNSFYVCIFT